jgi:hypothetical protein
MSCGILQSTRGFHGHRCSHETIASTEGKVVMFGMPTPAQQREYTRLSGLLQAIGRRFYTELPGGSTSLLMKVENGRVLLEGYDHYGKLLGTVPNEKTSGAFRVALAGSFAGAISPDPDGVVAIISNPAAVKAL